MRVTESLAGPPTSLDAQSRAAVVRALALGRNERRRAERAVDRALTLVDPAAGPAAVLAEAWSRPMRRRGRPVFDTGSGLDLDVARLDPDVRLAFVLDVLLAWPVEATAEALSITQVEVAELVRTAHERLGLSGPADRDELAAHLRVRAAEVPVTALDWSAARARGRRRQRRAPFLAAVAGTGLLAAVAFLGGGSGAPTPTVVRPAPARPLAASAEAEPAVLAPPGPVLGWTAVDLAEGVSLPLVRAWEGGFVALEAEVGAFFGPSGPPTAVWVSPDGERWERLDADLTAFTDDDFVSDVAAGPRGIVAVGGTYGDSAYAPFQYTSVWESSDGMAWVRRPLPGPTTPAPDDLAWGAQAQALAATDSVEVAVGIGILDIDYPKLLGDRLPDPLPPGFSIYEFQSRIVVAGPAGVPVVEFEYPTADFEELRDRQQAVPLTWVRGEDGDWEVVEVGELMRSMFFQTVSAAGDRFYATAYDLDSNSEVVLVSEDGRDWDRHPIAGAIRSLQVVGHPGGLSAGGFGLRMLASTDGESWQRLRLPATATSAAPEIMAGGEFGVVATGTMGSRGGQVVAPMVVIPGEPAPATLDLESGTFRVETEGGETRDLASYPDVVRVDFDAGTFDLVDPDDGKVLFTGNVADWHEGVEGAYRTPFPPTGPVVVWYSPDGTRWSLHGPEEGLAATGYPVSVAVGENAVVVAAAGEGGVARLWVGR